MRRTRFNPRGFQVNQIPMYLVLIPLSVFTGLPILFIFCHALKPIEELFAFPPRFFVRQPTLENFVKLFRQAGDSGIPVSRYVFNSLLVTGLTVLGSVVISTLAAFSLSKLRFPGKKLMMEINNLAMMFVATAVVIPRYLLIDKLGIMNTYLAHVLPLIALPVCLFLVKQFTDQVPDSLIEAAMIDGAGYFMVFRKIILPLIRPAVATVAIMSFQQVWNNQETSSMFTSQENMRTLTFFMGTLSNSSNGVAGQGMAAAASLIMFIPNLLIFILMQSNVMNTMAYSGMK